MQRTPSDPQQSQPSKPESAWSCRYTEAAKRCVGLDLYSQDAVNVAIEGLQEWARLVPQRSTGADGVPEPANEWGIGIERCVLRSLHSHLVAIGQPLLAARVRSEMADILQTAEAMDKCVFQDTPDSHALKRLVVTARIQAKAMIKLLSAVDMGCARHPDGEHAPRRKRGAPHRHDPVTDRKLMDEWGRVRGKAGMTRKEFCAMKGIAIRSFVQSQDRSRKHAAQASSAAPCAPGT